MFPHFDHHRIPTACGDIDLLTAGQGPAVLLLHGFPQTRAAWHLVAPGLSERFCVVVPDLPGYGDSPGPRPSADGRSHSKRAMAAALVEAMATLGHDRWHVAGHDRGGRVAYRMALDHPGHVASLVLLDIMTTLDTWEAMDARAAIRAYHWPFLAQEASFVEAMIGADPGFYLDHLLARWAGPGARLAPEAVAAYRAAMIRKSVLAAMAADYRAGAGIDPDLDRADRAAGRKLEAPLLILRGRHYAPAPMRPAWEPWSDDVREIEYDCGHFLAEECPEACIRDLAAHFGAAHFGAGPPAGSMPV